MIRVRWWISTSTQMNVVSSTDQVLTAVKNRLTAEGIDLPFPTQQILFHDQTENIDGDRSGQREGWPVRQNEASYPRASGRQHSRDPSENAKPERD
jgi:small-conductance mechanosensitive channel